MPILEEPCPVCGADSPAECTRDCDCASCREDARDAMADMDGSMERDDWEEE